MKLYRKMTEKDFRLAWVESLEDGTPIAITEYSGTLGDQDSYQCIKRAPRDEEVKILSECYAGPNDSRLPDDVKDLPIGKREDFVDMFNDNFYWYWKDGDDDYDVDKSKDENRIRNALAKAYKKIENEQVKPTTESLEKDGLTHIKETYHGIDPTSFKETRDGGFSNEITVLEKGWSLNGNYYGSKVLPQLAEGCRGKAVGYFNHGDTFNRDPRDWSIVTETGSVKGNKVKANIHVFQYPDGDMLKERIQYAKEKKADHLFGVSIDAFARVTEGEAEGREGTIIEEIVRLNSVDIVMIPAAGGGFNSKESIQESSKSIKKTHKKEYKVMDVATLKEQHPDTAKLLIEEGRAEVRSEADEKLKESETRYEAAEKNAQEQQERASKAEAKVEEFELKEAQADFKGEVKALLKAELSEGQNTERFLNLCLDLGSDKMDTIKEMIAERKESGHAPIVEGEGNSGPDEVKEEVKEDKVEESAKDRLADFKTRLKQRR